MLVSLNKGTVIGSRKKTDYLELKMIIFIMVTSLPILGISPTSTLILSLYTCLQVYTPQ